MPLEKLYAELVMCIVKIVRVVSTRWQDYLQNMMVIPSRHAINPKIANAKVLYLP